VFSLDTLLQWAERDERDEPDRVIAAPED